MIRSIIVIVSFTLLGVITSCQQHSGLWVNPASTREIVLFWPSRDSASDVPLSLKPVDPPHNQSSQGDRSIWLVDAYSSKYSSGDKIFTLVFHINEHKRDVGIAKLRYIRSQLFTGIGESDICFLGTLRGHADMIKLDYRFISGSNPNHGGIVFSVQDKRVALIRFCVKQSKYDILYMAIRPYGETFDQVRVGQLN